jgi:hypothetical protein
MKNTGSHARTAPTVHRRRSVPIGTRDRVRNEARRVNLFRVDGGYVVLAHGRGGGAEALGELAHRWPNYHLTLAIEAPRERAGWRIEELARQVAQDFDRIVIYEPEKLRGREPAEAAGLLQRTTRAAGAADCQVILDARRALRHCIDGMVEGDILVYCSDGTHALEILEEYGAKAVARIPPLRHVGVRRAAAAMRAAAR